MNLPSLSLRNSFKARLPTAKKIGAAAALAIILPMCGMAQTPAFPGALGFGAKATGGRNGTVYHVTNLSDSGSGSFREAVSGPNRIIVFDVGGTITLASAVSCSSSLTIAGQTAPGGIAIIGHEVSFSVQTNCIVRHLRIRPGSLASSTEDGIDMGDATNMIFDHISIEFAPYNNIDAHGNYTDGNQITIQNSILADPIGQQFNAHTEALYNTFSWCYNIFSSGHDRNPLAKVNNVFINNVVNNFQAGYTCADTSGNFSHDIINNYFIAGPATTSTGDDFFQFDNNQSVYSSGNLENVAMDGTLSGSATAPGGATTLNSPWSSLTPTIPTFPTFTAYRVDVSMAGALPRDQVDQNVLGDVMSLGTAGIGTALWKSQTSTGLGNNGYGVITPGTLPVDTDGDGMPDYWKAAVGLSLTSGSDAMAIASDGYANIEHYLNWLAAPNAVTLTNTPVNVDLAQFTAGFTNASPVYAVNNASNGTVVLNNGQIAQFTPKANFSGLGSFNFSVLDSDGSTMTSTVTICISPLAVTQTPPVVPSDNIFVALRSSSTGPSTTTIAPPPGYSYSAAAPVFGTTWNTVGLENLIGTNSTVGSTSNLYVNLALDNSSGASITPVLNITYTSVITTGTRSAPSGVNGENTLQPGGVMENAWRNYLNASGNYFTFTISGLSNSTPYDLYTEGATATSGQGAGIQLAAANVLGSEPASAATANTTTNSNDGYGSLWTVSGGSTNLMPQGTTWTVLHGQTDASGNFSFLFNGLGSSAYLNGFQLAPAASSGKGGLTASFSGGISLGNNGNAQFSYTGTSGQNYRIWATTNLTLTPVTNQWTQLTNGTFAGVTNQFRDTQSTNFSQRFYIITVP